ncbi:MAG TPA: hypothetical protein EYQ62_11545, partial [Verrucomicrobiales bacterium]|nr:hypothetical protein [Verrucomicrobiales bacterium]
MGTRRGHLRDGSEGAALGRAGGVADAGKLRRLQILGGAGAIDEFCRHGTGFGGGCVCGKAGGISGGFGLKIILASQSPRRQELLRQMGVRFRVVTAAVAEVHGHGRAARAVCKRNALAKAAAVAQNFPKQTVLGADTLVHLGDELFGKPKSLAEARRMLERLSARTHQVTTACALVCGGRQKVFSVTTRVT